MASTCDAIRQVAGADKDVTAGVVVLDLQTGARCDVNADRVFRSASLYKTIVVSELYRQVQEGLVDLDDKMTIEPRHHVDDPPDLRPKEPYTLRVSEAAERMITFSDNGAALALRELLGVDTVADATEWLGLPSTSLVGTFETTPADQAHLFEEIFHGRVVDRASSNAIMGLLLRQEVNDMIPAALPKDTPVAHKTGTLVEYLHDAGIVYAPGGAFVLVVMTENHDFDAAMDAIQDITTTAFAPYAEAAPPLLTAEAAFAQESSPGTAIPYVRATPARAATDVQVARTEGGTALLATAGSAEAPTLVVASPGNGRLPDLGLLGDPIVLAALLAFLTVAIGLPMMVLRRSPSVRYRADALLGQAVPSSPDVRSPLTAEDARLRADRSERGLVMRFGSRRDDEGRSASPASRSVAQVAEQPVLPSKRLQRVAEHFRSQGELLATMRDQFEEEMEPLHDLIVRQAQAMQSLLQNLEERLRPLNEYADGEEANLTALEERIQAGGQDHVARSFSQYLEEQRGRINQTREQIDRQRIPFLEYGDAQRGTVEAALSRFDNDIEALEQNLAEQRRVMVRMLDAMRSETFTAVKDYLDGRQVALAQMAESGSTDPGEIGRAAAALRRSMEALAGKSDYVRALLQEADVADRALIDAAPAPRPHAVPAVAVAAPDEATDVDEADVSA